MGERKQNSQPPFHSTNRPRGGWRAVKYILGNETFEKVASMSLISNMTVYLKTKYNMTGIFVVNVINIWAGGSNLTSIIGALISDSYLGRFRTLIAGSISSFLGMLTVTLTAAMPSLRPPACKERDNCIDPKGWQVGVLFTGLALLSIGAGGIRPCNIGFGADQFDQSTQKGRAALESFFNWWYFTFTLALIVVLTGVVYIQTNISWVVGFAIPTGCLFFSMIIFLCGYSTYILAKPQGSVFVDIAKVISAATKKRSLTTSGNSFYDPDHFIESGLKRSKRFNCLDKAAMIVDPDELDEQGKSKNDWRLCSVEKVESLKLLLGMMPVFVSGIFCLLNMDQQNTLGILQIIQTNRRIGSLKVPPAWMSLASMITLGIWVILYEQIWIPLTRGITGKPKRLSTSLRINLGLVCGIASCLVSAYTEIKRRKAALEHGTFESPLSVLYFLPQFCLSGLIEAFGAVAFMEFLTMQLPESMRTVAGAIFFVSFSIANYLNSALVNIVYKLTSLGGNHPWLRGQDLNKDKLERYYCLIVAIGVLNFIYFNLFARHFITDNHTGALVDQSGDKNEEKTLELA